MGNGLTVRVTLETEGAQGALETVHANTFAPTVKPVIVVVGESEFVITPLPETNVHTPEPTPGKLAAIVAVGVEIQSN